MERGELVRKYISSVRHNPRIVIIVLSCLILLLFGLTQLIQDTYLKEQVFLLDMILGILDFVIFFIYLLQFLKDGYWISNNEIIFFHNFRKNRKKLCEIKAIVISNAYIFYHGTNPINMWKEGKIVPCPWFSLFFDEIDLSRVTESDKMITSNDIETRIFVEQMKFGFVYQKSPVSAILKEYEGNIYITKSVYRNHESELKRELGTRTTFILPDQR